MSISKELLKAIRKDLDRALTEIATTHGLKAFKQGNRMTYDPDAGTFKVSVEGTVEGGIGAEAQRYLTERKWNQQWPDLNKIINLNGRMFSITGLTRGGKVTLLALATSKPHTYKRDAFDRMYPRDVSKLVKVDPPALLRRMAK